MLVYVVVGASGSIAVGNTIKPSKILGLIPDPHIGEKFGMLTILAAERRPRKFSTLGMEIVYHAQCECGNMSTPRRWAVLAGAVISCGCLNIKKLRESNITHGYAVNKHENPTYRIWQAMKDRTLRKNNIEWDAYGGRGIGICEKWMKFENFLNDMGECPPGLSIDRIDNDKGYCKENCRWATYSQQARNKRNTIFLTYENRTLPLATWAELQNVNYHYFWKKYKLGMSPDQIKELYSKTHPV